MEMPNRTKLQRPAQPRQTTPAGGIRRLRGPAIPIFGLAALLAAPGLLAQPGPPLERLDQDGDGLISREEFLADDRVPGMRMLDRADTDRDGAVTREELQAAIDNAAEEHRARAERHMAQRFDTLDEDGDGLIMRADVLEQAFYRLDSNGDGYISEEEAQEMRDRRHKRRGRRGDGPADPS